MSFFHFPLGYIFAYWYLKASEVAQQAKSTWLCKTYLTLILGTTLKEEN